MMSRRLVTMLVLGLALTTGGCTARTPGKTETKSAAGGHAPAGAVPGSHEDWCGEHNVPESACTRCDPALIAAYKATNDWCAEHGLPESQCLRCNPELKIERPAKADGH